MLATLNARHKIREHTRDNKRYTVPGTLANQRPECNTAFTPKGLKELSFDSGMVALVNSSSNKTSCNLRSIQVNDPVIYIQTL